MCYNSYLDSNGELKMEYREQAIAVLEKILKAFHNKEFSDVQVIVDESEIDDLEDFLTEFMQGTLELNDFDAVDEYGAEYHFNPQYEYSQLSIELYNDKSGFYLEYDMTSNGKLVDMVLQLKFIFTENCLKVIFENIDLQ
ncbi:MAG: hypothetical protein K2L19_09085 [Eubacterium sp.]|nr:hypothetical protein [Eubacterium sp.]